MRRLLEMRKWFIGLALLPALALLWLPLSYAHGCLDAQLDVMRGRYKILVYGLPAPWREDDASLLKLRYKVEERAVAGCMVSRSLTKYVEGYDRVSRNAANRKFGHDVFAEALNEVRLHWMQNHQGRD